MKLQIKIPSPPRLPQGPSALARDLYPPGGSTPRGAERRAIVARDEETRAWEPERAVPQPASASDFELAGAEQTMVGASNLNDPRVFRSQPPAAPIQDAEVEWPRDEEPDEETVVGVVGPFSDPNQNDPRSAMATMWGGEKTILYKPERAHPASEEPTEDFVVAAAEGEAKTMVTGLPKVIIAPALLADSATDPARTEATKRRRGRQGDSKLGLGLCLLGWLALALSVAWRHPRIASLTHDALARVAAAISSVRGK